MGCRRPGNFAAHLASRRALLARCACLVLGSHIASDTAVQEVLRHGTGGPAPVHCAAMTTSADRRTIMLSLLEEGGGGGGGNQQALKNQWLLRLGLVLSYRLACQGAKRAPDIPPTPHR